MSRKSCMVANLLIVVGMYEEIMHSRFPIVVWISLREFKYTFETTSAMILFPVTRNTKNVVQQANIVFSTAAITCKPVCFKHYAKKLCSCIPAIVLEFHLLVT